MICIAAGAASIVYSINDVWAALDVKDYLKIRARTIPW